jgi:hypothetical protein
MNIDQLKTELREFIALSERISPGKWRKEASRAYCTDESITYNVVGPPSDYMYLQEEPDADFIAHSRNISPTMAKGWLEVIETLNDMPHNVADALELKLLKLWEETK